MPYGVQALASGRCPYVFWCGRAPPIVCNDRSYIQRAYWMYRKDVSVCKGNGLTCESKLKLYKSSRAIPLSPRNSLSPKNWFFCDLRLFIAPSLHTDGMGSVLGRLACCPIQRQSVLPSGDFVSFLDWGDGYWIKAKETNENMGTNVSHRRWSENEKKWRFFSAPPSMHLLGKCSMLAPSVFSHSRKLAAKTKKKGISTFSLEITAFQRARKFSRSFYAMHLLMVHFWLWFGWLLRRPPKHWNGLLVVHNRWCTLDSTILCRPSYAYRVSSEHDNFIGSVTLTV